MNIASPESLRIAQEVVDSARVLRTYAACEWDELSDDGKHWIAAIVQEAQARAMTMKTRAALRQGGIRPAPFALSPALVARALKAVETSAPTVAPAIPAAKPPVAVDGPIEPARCPPKQATPSAPVESIPPALDRPDIWVAWDIGRDTTPAGDEHDDHARECTEVRPHDRPDGRVDYRPLGSKRVDRQDGEAGAVHGSTGRATAPRSADTAAETKAGRLALIRKTAERLQREKIAFPTSKELRRDLRSLGRPVAKSPTVPATDFDRRRRAIEGAIAFLKRECILVTVCDREALIRQYRVSGKRHVMLANEVIEFAAERGFEVPHA